MLQTYNLILGVQKVICNYPLRYDSNVNFAEHYVLPRDIFWEKTRKKTCSL